MSLADVQTIINGIQQGRDNALRQQQLSQQADQFKESLAQRVAEAKMRNDIDTKQLDLQQHQLEQHLAERPDLIANLPGVQNLGGISGLTTGDPKTETQQNLFQLPYKNAITGQPVTMQAPTPNAYANQIAGQKAIEMAPEIKARNDALAQEMQNRLAEIRLQQEGAKALETTRQGFETGQQSERLTVEKELAANRDALERHKIDVENTLRRDIANMQYGPGSVDANDINNAASNVYLLRSPVTDYDKMFQTKGMKNNLSGKVLSLGGITGKDYQIKALNQVDAIKEVLDKIDRFNDMSSWNPLNYGDKKRLQDEINSQLGVIAQTLNAEPGRKAGWMIKGAESGTTPNILDLTRQNTKRRNDLAKTARTYFNGVLNNLPPKQAAAIKADRGITEKFSPIGQTVNQNGTVPKTADDYLKSIGQQ